MSTRSSLAILVFVSGVVTSAQAPLAPLRSDDTLARQLRDIVGEKFQIRETDHFTICYDVSENDLRPLVERLEGVYEAVLRFTSESDLTKAPLTCRLPVIFFNHYEDFQRYASRSGLSGGNAGGFYSATNNIVAFCNTLDTPPLRDVNESIRKIEHTLTQTRLAEPDREQKLHAQLDALRTGRDELVTRFNQLVVQHEAAHQVFFNLGVLVRGATNPTWLVEGLACQFEVPHFDRQGGPLNINQMRLADAREALGVGEQGDAAGLALLLRLAIENGDWVPIAQFISSADPFEKAGAQAPKRYGQAWALVAFLQRNQPKAFAEYLRALMSRKPGERITAERERLDFEAAFGAIKPEDDLAWASAVLSWPFDAKAAGW